MKGLKKIARKRARDSEEFIRSAIANKYDFLDYVEILTNLAISRFKWEDLPDTMDRRFLELTLFEQGQAIVLYDDIIGGLLGLRVMMGGQLDVYGYPVYSTGYGMNGAQYSVDQSNSVLIFNNFTRTPTQNLVLKYALRLYEYDRVIDVNVNAQKTPILVLCDENMRLSLENVYAKYTGNQPVIFGRKDLLNGDFTALKTDAPYVSDKIYELKRNVFNECLTMLGIANVAENKKERLISDEVNRALGGTLASRQSALEMRQIGADKVNEMFGTDIKVSFDDDIESITDTAYGYMDEGVDDIE